MIKKTVKLKGEDGKEREVEVHSPLAAQMALVTRLGPALAAFTFGMSDEQGADVMAAVAELSDLTQEEVEGLEITDLLAIANEVATVTADMVNPSRKRSRRPSSASKPAGT